MQMTSLPASPDAVKYFNLTNGRAVVRWQHTGPVNTTTRTTVALDNCMPVGQDVYSTQKGMCPLDSVLRAAEHLKACLHERRVPNWSSNAVSHDNAQLCAFRRATRLDTATKILTRATLELSFDDRSLWSHLLSVIDWSLHQNHRRLSNKLGPAPIPPKQSYHKLTSLIVLAMVFTRPILAPRYRAIPCWPTNWAMNIGRNHLKAG